MFTKKGAIELSISTIIVIVIGVTLLILGLVFVRGIFERTDTLVLQAFDDAEREIQQRMGATDKIYISGGLRWQLEAGKPAGRVIGIQNFDENLQSKSEFKVQITPTDGDGKQEWFTIAQPGEIEVGGKATSPVEISLPAGLPPGSNYTFLVRILKDNQQYASQSIIVSIKQ